MGVLPWERSTPALKEQGLKEIHIPQETILEAERAVAEASTETESGKAQPSLVQTQHWGPLLWISEPPPGLSTSTPQQSSELTQTPSASMVS